MQFFERGRIWNTEKSDLIATSNWRECHIDTNPDWQRNLYYRTADGEYFYVTEIRESVSFLSQMLGVTPRVSHTWCLLKNANAMAQRLQSDLGATDETMALIRSLGFAA